MHVDTSFTTPTTSAHRCDSLRGCASFAVGSVHLFSVSGHVYAAGSPQCISRYVSTAFPQLSEHGAFGPSLVYTADDIRQVVAAARARGIRVIPEVTTAVLRNSVIRTIADSFVAPGFT
jgi:hypothetical protein